MLNINELEKRWLRYKIKSYIPHAVIVLSSVVIAFIAINTLGNKTPNNVIQTTKAIKSEKTENKSAGTKEVAIDKNTQQEIIKEEPAEVIAENKPQPKSIEKKTVMTPSLNFLNNIQSAPVIEALPEEVVIELQPKKEEIQKKEESEIYENRNNTIDIKRKNTQNDIQSVIKRFKKSNSPALSLFIAKNYYELGDYNLAYNYALITNEIDNNIEASWIIFAKSLVKLDKKEKAVATLKEYIQHSHSSNAKTLLDAIISGEMK